MNLSSADLCQSSSCAITTGAGREGAGGLSARWERLQKWSQSEILLYDDDPYMRMSYPDLVEEDGKFYVTIPLRASEAVGNCQVGS